jgi:hypothetical protein
MSRPKPARIPLPKSRGTHYHGIEALSRKDGIDTGGYARAKEFTTEEMLARPAQLVKAAHMKAANPQGWKGWQVKDIARTVNNYTRDENGELWA